MLRRTAASSLSTALSSWGPKVLLFLCVGMLTACGVPANVAVETPAGPVISQSPPTVAQPRGGRVMGAMRVATRAPLEARVDDFAIYAPAGLTDPAPVLVLLHGMGGNGDELIDEFRSEADASGWILVAPTFNYGDWRSPSRVTTEAQEHLPRMTAILDRLPAITGVETQRRAMLYGFSRGGQTANRIALAFPERVAAVAILSAGTYTSPIESMTRDGRETPVAFPFGVADLSRVAGVSFDATGFCRVGFWIGVGEKDASPEDVPADWDPYIGRNRVERANRFADWVKSMGGRAEVHTFAGLGHGVLPIERNAAMGFLTANI
jgi:poly(3-hydroxybutyrate) depolymerase